MTLIQFGYMIIIPLTIILMLYLKLVKNWDVFSVLCRFSGYFPEAGETHSTNGLPLTGIIGLGKEKHVIYHQQQNEISFFKTQIHHFQTGYTWLINAQAGGQDSQLPAAFQPIFQSFSISAS